MGKSVHLLAAVAVLELRKRIQNSAREVALEAVETVEDEVVVLFRSLRHAAIAGNALDVGSISHLASLPFGVTSRAARWPAAGHSMQRPGRPLGAAKKNACLNFHRSMPCGKLILPHLRLRPRVDVEMAEHILSANQRRRFARRFLMSCRRHHLEQE